MSKASSYTSKQSNSDGIIHWTDDENQIWSELVAQQMACIEGRACDEFFVGLDKLKLPTDHIPQLNDVSRVLMDTTGWQCAEVPALINFEKFFQLLANKQFPVATFIRRREHFDYLQEPDIFHEIFGHCAMLTNPDFCEFTHKYGLLGLSATKAQRVYLARLYWFTVEFGLMQQRDGLRIYGGGILSSPGETVYALESDAPERFEMNIVDVLRTPYRIDIMQPKYFIIDAIHDLFELSQLDIMSIVDEAMALGLHAPTFPPKEETKKTA